MEVTEKIIWFMLSKAERVKEICDVEYFTDEDIESIRRLDKDRLKFVWEMIMCYVDDFEHGLGYGTCPFCIYYCVKSIGAYFESDCEKCPYGKLHGICKKEDSDFQKIIKSNNFYIIMFSNRFYKKLIQDIENY